MSFSTYSDLKDSILAWMGRPGDPLIPTADLVALFEADASRQLRTHYQETHVDITTVADTDTYDLPDDFLAPREVKITSTSPVVELDYLTPAQLDETWISTSNSQPFNYTLEGSQIRFGPAPDGVYTIRVQYWQAIPPLADSSYAATALAVVAQGSDYTVGDTLIVSGGDPAELVTLIAVDTVQAADSSDATGLVIADGGTGYTAGDILNVLGGTYAVQAQVTVDTVDVDGAVLTAHISVAGDYSVTPANDAAVNGGSGTGCTLTLTWTLVTPAGAILTAHISEAGDYTAAPTNAVQVTGGNGNGATFNLTYTASGGDTNWLLDFYPDAYLWGSLAEAELFLGADNSTPRFQLFMQRREAAYAGIRLQDQRYRLGGAPLVMRTDTGNP